MERFFETRKLTKVYGGLIANNEIDLVMEKGSVVGLIGPNGSGKTTFINQISGVEPPTRGEILLNGVDVSAYGAHMISTHGIARTFQRIRLFHNLSVVENVLAARRSFYTTNLFDVIFHTRKLKQQESAQFDRAMELLAMVGLEREAHQKPSQLPYGKRRSLEIARALALEPEILLLDEPAAGMNKDEFGHIMNIMKLLKEQGMTILLVEHTMDFIRQVVDTVYVLNFGSVIAHGTFAEIENNKDVITAYLGDDEE